MAMSEKRKAATQMLVDTLRQDYDLTKSLKVCSLIENLQAGKMLSKEEAKFVEATIAEKVRIFGRRAINETNPYVCRMLEDVAILNDAYQYFARPGTYYV